jgi:serine/threonine protein kinase/Leucine-rich repeat (LRR) protein
MRQQPNSEQENLVRQLAQLAQNPDAPVDSTVRGVHAELETLAESLKRPLPSDPFVEESACRRAVEAAKALATEMTVARKPTADVLAIPLPERLEHFRILKVLGQGGMGSVYLAEDTRLGRQVALKTMRPELATKPGAKERFLREARLAAALEHDHIVPIYHVGEADGTPYLAMPLLKGQSLDVRIKGKLKLPPHEVIRVGIQIAAGLAAAHDKGLIHRDIKPSNLWVEPCPGEPWASALRAFRIKILDFGLARSSEADSGVTQPGVILGTPSYMAPEQARGEKLDARADLYSLGVVLYRLATGELPLKGKDTMSMLMALASRTPRPAHEINPELPVELSALIMRLLSKEPEQRPASAQAVMQELQALLPTVAAISAIQPLAVPTNVPVNDNPRARVEIPSGGSNVESTPTERAPISTRRRHRRWPVVLASLLGFVVLLSAGVIIIVRNKDGLKIAEIEVPSGGKVEIVDHSGSTETPLQKEPKIKIIGDPDRRATEYVLSIGGQVRINDLDPWMAALPKKPFRLTGVNLDNNRKVTDAGLAHLRDCTNLTFLNLNHTQVTDAGLAHFKDCKYLTTLHLGNTQVTDAGLAYFQDCKGLTALGLRSTRVTDGGLAHFKDCKRLTVLGLNGTRVTDAGLAHFQDCKGLRMLDLHGTRITDAGLAHFQNCKGLTHLYLHLTGVTDLGLAHFQECRGLLDLGLSGTRVTDLGLAHFQDCKDLNLLELDNTQVTDAGLAHFRDCKDLRHLNLGHTRVTDAGLAHFKDCKQLLALGLSGTRVTDAGLAHFQDCNGLKTLNLNGTQVTDAGMAHFKDCKGLTYLYLQGTKVTAKLIDELNQALPKCQIEWDRPKE